MSTDIPNQADPQRAIDAAQRKLDTHDGLADGKIDQQSVQVEQDNLTAVYIGKVNDVQGKISEARRAVEIGKNARSPHWQALDRTCSEVENGLLERMAKIDPETMHEMVYAFDADISTLLGTLATPVIEEVTQPLDATPEKAETLMNALGLPQEGSDVLIQAAIDQYGADGIRAVVANIELTARVPESLHQELFGVAPMKIGKSAESAKIAIHLATGSLENSQYAYLLQEPAVQIRLALEAARDRGGRVQAQIDAQCENVTQLMHRIAEDTKGLHYGWRDNLMDLLRLGAHLQPGIISSSVIERALPSRIAVTDKRIQGYVDEILKARVRIAGSSTEQEGIGGICTSLDIALAVGAAKSAHFEGRTEESDRRYAKILEEHGASLQQSDPPLARQAKQSAEQLRDNGKLSSTEKSLLFDDPRSPQTLRIAVEQKLSESTAVDMFDQVRAKQTFRAVSFEKFTQNNVFYNGHDATPALRSGLRTTLTYSSGKTLDVIATTQAQRILQNLPPGKEPILLRPISSIHLGRTTVSGGHNAVTRTELLNAPRDFIVQHTDIGFVDESGNVVRDDGRTPVELSVSHDRGFIEAQIRNQKAFRMKTYRPNLPLRTLDNKAYSHHLYTIKTQSGITVEGVAVANEALDLVNAEPPQGETLVLKRIPRAIDLRAVDTEQINGGGRGAGTRNYQRVLRTDMVRKEDLAYAKIDGDSLNTKDVSTGKEEHVSLAQVQKEQEEKTRDIERVLDRNPAIHGVKRCASTIQQTVGHLQKFLEAGQTGSARESFVKFAREEAKPTLEMLQNPQLKQDVEEAKIALRALKGVNGVALGGLEKKIDEQIKALDGFTAMLTDGRTQHLLETIMDASKFDADTWRNFFANELPVIVASIAIACAAAAIVVATCGGAAPFIAVAAATALGGVIGTEIGKEVVHRGHHVFDQRLRSGDAMFTERSRFGKWAEGQQEFDENTGAYREREFFRDVGNPLAQEFSQAFVVSLATMGIGNVVGGQLSKLLQNSKIIEKLTARSDILNSVTRKLARLNSNKTALEKSTNLREAVERALRTLPKEIGDEFGDEGKEQVLESFLNHLDVSLAAADAVDGKLGIGTLTGVLLAIAKNIKVGKATIKYDVRGKSPEALAARTKAIQVEAESNGAIVTDLGNGYLTIRHPIEVNGQLQLETVQMEPNVILASDGAEVSDAENAFSVSSIASTNGKIIEARNAENASPEAAQTAADVFVQNRIEEAMRVASGEASVEECITFAGGKISVEKQMAGVNKKRTEKGKPAYESVDEFVEAEVRGNARKFGEIIAKIDAGSIGGNGSSYFDNEFAIRDLDKLVPGLDMEGKAAIARRLHQAAMQKNPQWLEHAKKTGVENANEQEYYRWLTSTETTMSHTNANGERRDGRPPLQNDLPADEPLSIADIPNVRTRLDAAVQMIKNHAAENSTTPFTEGEIQKVLGEIKNPLDQAILKETARIMGAIESKAGGRSLTDAERWKVLEFSARYVQDFRAAKFPASPEQLLTIVTDNAVSLAHQQIMDHQTLVGSSHGLLHVLRGNATMLQGLYDQLGFTPEQRILAMQATFDHDVGYGKRTLAGQRFEQGVFAASKDHPLESTLVVEANRARYEAIFGRDGYVAIRNAILDHSDPLGRGQYADNVTKLQLLTDPNADPAERVAAAVALVDCLATVNNLKTSPLLRDNPEVMAMFCRVGEIHARINELKEKNALKFQIEQLKSEAKNIRIELQKRIEQMKKIGSLDAAEADAYLQSLESTMQVENSDFAINLNLGMLGASVSSDLRIEEGKVHVGYAVDPKGQALMEKVVGPEQAKKMGADALLKAANDFGGLNDTDVKILKAYVDAVRDSTKPAGNPKRVAADTYLQKTPSLTLTTKAGLVMEFTVEQNPQYAEVADVIETNLRINAIRDFARLNLDKIMSGEPLTVRSADGQDEIIITDPETYTSRTKDAVRSLIQSLPDNYVVESTDGTYVALHTEYESTLRLTNAMQRQSATQAEIAQKWADFCGRIYRSAGSEAPIAPRSSQASPRRRAA